MTFLKSLLRKMLGNRKAPPVSPEPSQRETVRDGESEAVSIGSGHEAPVSQFRGRSPPSPCRGIGHGTRSRMVDPERIQLIIGLDFGTSFTKVVIGAPRRAPLESLPSENPTSCRGSCQYQRMVESSWAQ